MGRWDQLVSRKGRFGRNRGWHCGWSAINSCGIESRLAHLLISSRSSVGDATTGIPRICSISRDLAQGRHFEFLVSDSQHFI